MERAKGIELEMVSDSLSKEQPIGQSPADGIKRTLILGIGNALRGDDGVGSAVIAALREDNDFPPSIDLVDGGVAGMKILTLLEGYDHAILVDAGDLGLPVGAWRRFNLETILGCSGYALFRCSMHDAGLVDALEVGRMLKVLPEALAIYLLQVGETDHSIGLTADVCRKIPALCDAIRLEALGHPENLLPV